MAEYIDRQALIEDLEYDIELCARALDDMNLVGMERKHIQDDKDCKQNVIAFLRSSPAADVRENKHGHWIETEDGGLQCSECGHISCDEIYEYEPPKNNLKNITKIIISKGSPIWVLRNPYYCGKCGADMRGKDNGE